MQQPPCDLTKIFLVHRAAHPKLKDSIAYTADSQPWATFAAFRANLVHHAGPFDQQIARGTPGDTNGGDNARYRRNQRRNFTPHQQLRPSGGVNKPSHGKGKPKPKPDGPPTCHGCGEKGHIRKHCPKEQKVGTATAAACNDSSEAELPACAAVDNSVRQDLLLLSSDAGQQALLHMASSAAVSAEFLQTAMFTPVVGLTVHANSFAALAEVRDASMLSADASMLSEPSPDSLQDVKERYYALIADLTPEWRDAILGPGRSSYDPMRARRVPSVNRATWFLLRVHRVTWLLLCFTSFTPAFSTSASSSLQKASCRLTAQHSNGVNSRHSSGSSRHSRHISSSKHSSSSSSSHV
jgi:hypothetical protein